MRGSMIETPCERTEDDQVEETLTRIPDLHTSTTASPGLTPYESSGCGKASMRPPSSERRASALPHYKPQEREDCGAKQYGLNSLTCFQRCTEAHTGNGPCECEVCVKSSCFPDTLGVHQEAHSGKTPYQYKECGKTSVYAHGGSRTMGRFYECNICGKALSSSTSLQRHVIIHTERLYECTYCGKAFRYPKYLRLHERIHTGEKPYECQDCGRAFNQNSSLGRHKRTHTGEKPYTCSVCGKSFSRTTCLFLHLRTHTEERPYECNHCGKGFRHSSSLAQHQRKHAGEKPYECRQRLIFEQAPALTKLEWTEPLSCDPPLSQSERTQQSDRPFKCNQCGKCFIQSSHLIRHQITHNREEEPVRGRSRRREQHCRPGSKLIRNPHSNSKEVPIAQAKAGQASRALALFDLHEIMQEKNSVHVIGVEEPSVGNSMLFDIRESR